MRFFRKNFIRRIAATLAILMLAAACQPLPRPFAPNEAERDSNSRMLKLPDSGGIVVLPLAGTSEAISARLVDTMIKALHELNIPAATSGSNKRAQTLQGWLASRGTNHRTLEVKIVWDLFDRSGRATGSRKLRWRVAKKHWLSGDAVILKVVAHESAAAIATAIQEPTPKPAPSKPPHPAADGLPPIQVLAVEGAPGDGSKTLRRAMEKELRRQGYPVYDKARKQGLIIAGTVHIGPSRNSMQTVRLVWLVRRNDGTAIGKVLQNNTVAAGSLGGPWGQLAGTVANNAGGGLARLLKRAVADSK